MHIRRQADSDATGLRLAIAVSGYHRDITDALCAGAVEAFTKAGGTEDALLIAPAPGTFELTAVSQALAARPDVDGVVALGCVIRGETSHDQHLARAVANGLTRIALDTGKPVSFGILTCDTKHQARARAGGEKGNKGIEAMEATIDTIRSINAIAKTPGRTGDGERR